jgi:hypothetical protein
MGDEGAEALSLPSSSAERDHGLRERLRKSPRSAEEPFLPGDEGELARPSALVGACVRERSNTDLKRDSGITTTAFRLNEY